MSKKITAQRTTLMTLLGLKEPEDPATFYERVWKGMPEFTRGSTMPFQKIVVNFETREDVKRFEAIAGQRLTDSTNSIWFPYKGMENMKGGLVYIGDDKTREVP